MSSKNESEPNIKYILGTAVGLVRRFIKIQYFGHNWRRTDGIRVEYFVKIHSIAARPRSPTVPAQNGRPNTIPKTNYSSCRCSMTPYGKLQTMKRNVLLTPHLSLLTKRFPARRWSFLGPETKWYSTYIDRPRREWDRVAELMMINSKTTDTQFPGPRVHCAQERSKAKEVGNYLYTFVPMVIRLKLFPTIASDNQLSINGTISDLCEEYKSCHVRTRRLVLVWLSDLLFFTTNSLMKTPTPSTLDLSQEDLVQNFQEWVDKLSQQNRVIKFCTDASFLTTVDVGQYFVKKTLTNSQNIKNQWRVGNTLCHEMKNHLTRKVGFDGTPKLGPYWKSQPIAPNEKDGVEIRIESVNKDTSHSWVWISHGLNKLVTDLIDKDCDDIEKEIWHEDGSICVCKPIQSWNTNEKTFHYMLLFKDCNLFLKENEFPSVDNNPPTSKKWIMTSKYQNCHLQLWKKQKFSSFESSSRRSKTSSSRSTSNRLVTNRKRWSSNCAI